MNRFILALAAAVSCIGPTLSQTADAPPVKYSVTLSGSQEVPVNNSPGTGKADLTLTGTELAWTISFDKLSGPASAGHIHGPAAPGTNAGVVIPLGQPNQPLVSPIVGKATLTEEQIADLTAGKLYVNIHTAAFRGGEIRGQITK